MSRLRFYQGYFVRRSIDVWPDRMAGDKLAEFDVVAIGLDPQLRRRLEVIECKTGARGAKEIDRVLWLRGVREFTSAQDVSFAKLRIADRVREVARRVNVGILDESAMRAGEEAAGVPKNGWAGLADPELGELIIKPAREYLNGSDALNRAGKYLFGSFWLEDEFTRLKRLRTLASLLREHGHKVDPNAFILACGELVSLFTLTVLEITSWRGQYDPDEFARFAAVRLSTGLGDQAALRQLLQRVDAMTRDVAEDLHQAYTASGVARVSRRVPQLESEVLRVPEWVDALLDLSNRLQVNAIHAGVLLQALDLRLAQRLGSQRDDSEIRKRWRAHEEKIDDLVHIVERFCVAVWGMPAEGLDLGALLRARRQVNKSPSTRTSD